MTFIGQYILDEHGQPVPCEDTLEWGAWFETSHAARRVAVTDLHERGRVSTVFLALDHDFGSMRDKTNPYPVLWETMVFGGPCGGEMNRYRSREAAEKGHQEMVAKCMEASLWGEGQ